MDYYKHFYDLVEEYPEMSSVYVYAGVCQAIANNPKANKRDLMELTRAYKEYKGENQNGTAKN